MLQTAVKSSKESSYFKYISTAVQQGFTVEDGQQTTSTSQVPDDAQIVIYKSYTRYINDEYITNVSGCIFCPGIMSRKNKLLLSMIQRLSKTNVSSTTVNQFETQLEESLVHPDLKGTESDTDSTISTSSSASVATHSDIIKERMQGIIARNIPKTPLKITIGSEVETDSVLGASLYSDPMGSFQISIATQYVPSYIAVSSQENPNIIQTKDTNIILPYGVSVITDIDDTVRITGVLAEKRELFRNVFGRDFSECEVPRLSKWLQILSQEFKCSIHYVSNSPWQIYNIVLGFLNHVGLPIDSIHLRQYSGNLIASFTQPSAERKKGSLVKILKDFPNRKFILIGDAGEQDLEAYLSLAESFPNQILAIYIRALTGAFSSVNEDAKSYKELQSILNNRSLETPTLQNLEPLTSTTTLSIDSNSTVVQPSSPRKKMSPLPPAKPRSLKGQPIFKHSEQELPLGPDSPTLESSQSGASTSNSLSKNDAHPQANPPPIPKRRNTIEMLTTNQQLRQSSSPGMVRNVMIQPGPIVGANIDENGDVVYDKRRDMWRDRVYNVVTTLKPEIEFKFWWDVNDVMQHSFDLVERELNLPVSGSTNPTATKNKASDQENLIDL
ncbi:hypothetical protein CANARDRAFT_198518 [[Candida] arabinofermentans NRRL YB-2248]|uniref:Phosphatidate phosphatase APP1 catalytic domain-containing protein n=1 Tax=[Candida] arabinofermentans NRRL YB-2248 TaxID=983967 RepID=A0A1E4T1A8_9ASCO|nr:hypothetical protein CANARDRAFT_198518 [[Candida] arabinofermentans NRRL YB-2248]